MNLPRVIVQNAAGVAFWCPYFYVPLFIILHSIIVHDTKSPVTVPAIKAINQSLTLILSRYSANFYVQALHDDYGEFLS